MGSIWSSEEEDKLVPFVNATKGDVIFDITHIIINYINNKELIENQLYIIPTDIKVKSNHSVVFDSAYLDVVYLRCGDNYMYARGCKWYIEIEEHIILLKRERKEQMKARDMDRVLIRMKASRK